MSQHSNLQASVAKKWVALHKAGCPAKTLNMLPAGAHRCQTIMISSSTAQQPPRTRTGTVYF